MRADLLDASSVVQAVASVRLPRIDVLCNIAGGFRMGHPVHETPENVWELMLDLNAKSLINTARAVVPKMLAAGRGKIVNIGAVAGLAGKANMGAYSASKSAVIRLMERNPSVDWGSLDDVIYGCVNQAGEDNRNVARMALLLAGLPHRVPGATVNRLCGSSLDAVGTAARAIRCGETQLMIAGGVESMSRAPFVIPKSDSAFSRAAKIEDTTIGWRFVNPLMKAKYGIDSMPETAENVAEEFKVGRADQDAFALRSQQRWAAAQARGFYRSEVVPVSVPGKKGAATMVDRDEHPRPDATLDGLAKLKGVVKADGTVTAGNASGVNDGACAMILASDAAARKHKLTP